MRLVVPLLAASVAGFGVLPPPAKPSLAKIAALANTCVYRLSPYLVDALGGLEFVNRTYYAWAPYPGVMLHPKIEHTSLDMTGPPTKNGTAAGVGIFLDKSKLAGPALVTPCGQDPPALVETLANATLGLKSVGEGSSPPFQGTLESYGLHMPWVYAAQFD